MYSFVWGVIIGVVVGMILAALFMADDDDWKGW